MKCFRDFFEFIPPLRLIITDECNGKCGFCHKEGFQSVGDMPVDTIKECVQIANDLNINHICITGGEPSLRNDLPDILNYIELNFSGNLVLTSNGANLLRFSDRINAPIFKLNISITSFHEEIAREYQNVDPNTIITILNNFPALHKNLNLVMVRENYDEIGDVIDFCVRNGVSLDVMSELKEYDKEELEKYTEIIKKFKFDYRPYIDVFRTPKLVVYDDGKCKISIKHPSLNSIYVRDICARCINKCYENICAIRVYPDLKVSPCLNNTYVFDDKSLRNNIASAYYFVMNKI